MEAKDLYRELEPIRAQRKYEQANGIKYPESRNERYLRYFVTGGLGLFTLPIVYLTAEGAVVSVLTSSSAAMSTTVATITWASNPNTWLLASTTAGFVFEVLNPDPNGFAIDFPGNGDEFGKAVKWLFRTKAGKQVEFAAEQGARYANTSEFHWAGKLLDEGNNVKLLKESTEKGVSSADMLVNGIRTEIKEISNMTPGEKFVRNLVNKLSEAASQVGKGGAIIIDMTKQKGVTKEAVEETIKQLNRKGVKDVSYRIVTSSGETKGVFSGKNE